MSVMTPCALQSLWRMWNENRIVLIHSNPWLPLLICRQCMDILCPEGILLVNAVRYWFLSTTSFPYGPSLQSAVGISEAVVVHLIAFCDYYSRDNCWCSLLANCLRMMYKFWQLPFLCAPHKMCRIMLWRCLSLCHYVHPYVDMSVQKHPFLHDKSKCFTQLSHSKLKFSNRSMMTQKVLELSSWNLEQILFRGKARCLFILGGHHELWGH